MQYVAMSRKVAVSIENHLQLLGDEDFHTCKALTWSTAHAHTHARTYAVLCMCRKHARARTRIIRMFMPAHAQTHARTHTLTQRAVRESVSPSLSVRTYHPYGRDQPPCGHGNGVDSILETQYPNPS